jgi:hypothetical protein
MFQIRLGTPLGTILIWNQTTCTSQNYVILSLQLFFMSFKNHKKNHLRTSLPHLTHTVKFFSNDCPLDNPILWCTSFSGLLTFTYFDRTRCYKSRPIIASCPTMAFASSPDHPTLHPHWWHSPAALPRSLRSNSLSVVSAASILDISWFVTFH